MSAQMIICCPDNWASLSSIFRILRSSDGHMIGNAASGNTAAVLQLQTKVPQWLTGRDEVTDTIQK